MHIRTALVALALAVAGAAHAEKPDLTGAVFVLAGNCRTEGQATPCAIYEKKGVQYMVFRDYDDGEIIMIFRVRDGAAFPYRTGDFELLWSKDHEVRMRA